MALVATPAARADSPELREEVKSEHVWYGPEVAIAYGAAYALIFPGLAIRQDSAAGWNVVGTLMVGAGGVVSVVVPPAIHWGNDNFNGGLASFGGQFGAVLVGGLTGAAVAELAGADGPGSAILLGAAIGHAAWAIFDVFVLAHVDRVTERRFYTNRLWLTPVPSR